MVFKSAIINGMVKNEVDLVANETTTKIGNVNGAITLIVHAETIIIPLKIFLFKDMVISFIKCIFV